MDKVMEVAVFSSASRTPLGGDRCNFFQIGYYRL